MNKKRYGKQVEIKLPEPKPLVVHPHPRQSDIDKFKAIPSLVTGGWYVKYERTRDEAAPL